MGFRNLADLRSFSLWLAWLVGCVAILLLAMGALQGALAMPASPHPVLVEQPDGKRVELRIRGGAERSWLEDRRGYTVVREHGRFVYAREAGDGSLEGTEFEVGRVNPRARGLRKGLRPPRTPNIGMPDFVILSLGFGLPPGPSGLACAGQAPCVAP